jgi:hypothetical protein
MKALLHQFQSAPTSDCRIMAGAILGSTVLLALMGVARLLE